MGSPLLPRQRTKDRRGVLAHMCPQCRKPWALNAAFSHPRLVVVCRYCSYERLISLPQQPEGSQRTGAAQG